MLRLLQKKRRTPFAKASKRSLRRIEVVLIMGEEIIWNGGDACLGPLKILRYDSAEGRMVGLLPREGTAH